MSTHEVDVIIVGAGISGIGAARELAGTGRTVAVLEARDDIGGTWDLFRYPGIRSDSDMATFGYRSRPWTGERSLATGDTILEYVRAAAEEAGVLEDIRFGQRARRAEWSSDTHTWTVTHEDVHTGEVSRLRGRWLFMATGYYRYDEGFTPDWPTLPEFRGTVVHPQHWPEDLDVAGRRVVVIGSGATAITLVPSLVDRGARVSMLQRSPSYVASVPGRDEAGIRLRRRLPPRLAGAANRWRNIARGMAVYEFSRRRPQAMRELLHRGAVKHLGPTFPVDEHFTPEYDPWDQRLCAAPDGDFFRAVRGEDAEVVTDTIERFTPDGIQLASGRHLDADVVVTATGLNVQFLGNTELVVDGETVDPAQHVSYRGMMLDAVPNMAFAIGYTNSSWTLRVDLVTEYFHRVLDRMDRAGAVAVTPRYSGPRTGLRPLIDLASGYIQRGAHLLPRQGADGAWNVRQNYLRDKVLFRPGTERDDQLEFTFAPAADGQQTDLQHWNGLQYRDTGAGTPVLLIHGIGRSLKDWDEQHELLSAGHRVVSVDLPGFGGSEVPPEGMRLEHLAARVAGLVETLGIAPVHVVGNSLGGAVAMQLTADRPDLVRSLLLVDSAGFGRGVSPALRLASIPGVGERALAPSRKGALRSERAMYHDPRFATPERVAHNHRLSQRPGGSEAMLEMLRSVGTPAGVRSGWRAALVPRVRATGLPVFIVWGDKDTVLPFRHLARGAKALGARTHRFRNTGHGPMIERADEFARLATEFWSDVDRA